MALPVSSTPIYSLKIPSTKKEFKYRPFVVKEEKALMIAQESEDMGVMLDTIKNVIESCAKSPIDVSTLASFDIEYIFLNLRAKSVGEYVDLVFACDEDHGEDNVKAQKQVTIDLRKAVVETAPEHVTKIELFDDVGVVMKYPSLEVLKLIETSDDSNIDVQFDIISGCIDFIYQADELFAAKDQTKEELIEFLNNLTSQQFGKIKQFFQTMPQVRVYVDYDCPVCGKKHNKYMEGLASFF